MPVTIIRIKIIERGECEVAGEAAGRLDVPRKEAGRLTRRRSSNKARCRQADLTCLARRLAASPVAEAIEERGSIGQEKEKKVSRVGIEPTTSCLKGRCSTN